MSALSATSASSAVSSLGGTLSVKGLVSGLDTDKIIQGLLAIEQAKISAIDAKVSVLQTKQTAYKTLEARLLSLQGQMTQLSRSQNGIFDARSVQSSDEDLVTAAASSSAVPGVYHFRVNSLATAQQIASQGFDSAASAVTDGTLQITVGSATKTITVDSTNDTLQGLADAINAADAGASAFVVNDGAGDGSQGYRLLLVANDAGTANRITITNNLAASSGPATKPIFDTNQIGAARAGAQDTGTSAATSNAGSTYTGTSNGAYTFTVVQGGTVGTDTVQLSYTDATGAHTGTITLNTADADVFKDAAEGVQIKFGAGTLIAGDTYTVKTFVPNVQNATDASVTLGSGAGAMTVTSATNTINTLIPGVTLNLQSADPNKDVTLTVAADTDKIKTTITDFVSAFNDTLDFIDQQITYDTTSGKAGPLLGDRQVLTIQQQLQTAMNDVIPGANPLLNHLGALGISTDDNGKLVVDDAKLSTVLSGGKNGVTLGDVRRLFALGGISANNGIQFVTGSTKTVASNYTVHVTQAAEKASLTGATALAASTVIDNTNNTFVFGLDGATSATLTLAAGTYSRQALAQAVQAAINSDTTLQGRQVSVSLTGDNLTLTSNRYGAASNVTATSGTALAALGFTAGASDQGADVAGSYVVNGVTETAVGNGQFLLGDSTNADTADLQVRVLLTPAQVSAGIDADLTVSRGIASRLDRTLTSLFDPVNGRLKSIDDDFNTSIDALNEQKSKQNEIMQTKQASLEQQFLAMENALSQLQSTSNFLSLQSANVQKK